MISFTINLLEIEFFRAKCYSLSENWKGPFEPAQ